MGWSWFIPAFHVPRPPSGAQPGTARVLLTRKEIDFPLGVGAGIIDMEVAMEWLPEADTESVQLPARTSSEEGSGEGTGEPAGIAATVQAVTAGGVGDVVQAKQAAED